MKRNIVSGVIVILVIAFVLLLPNYVPGIGIYTVNRPAGFTSGVWHGWISPISLFLSIFNSSISIYEPVNSGWWYDCGYYMAIVGGFGGLTLFRRPLTKDSNDKIK